MKTLIHEVNEVSGKTYQLFAETNTANGYTHLQFYTVWNGAKDPSGTQKKFEAFLPAESINSLVKALSNELA